MYVVVLHLNDEPSTCRFNSCDCCAAACNSLTGENILLISLSAAPFFCRSFALLPGDSLEGKCMQAAAAWGVPAAVQVVAQLVLGGPRCNCHCGAVADPGLLSLIEGQLSRCGPEQLTQPVAPPACPLQWAFGICGFLLGVLCCLAVAACVSGGLFVNASKGVDLADTLAARSPHLREVRRSGKPVARAYPASAGVVAILGGSDSDLGWLH